MPENINVAISTEFFSAFARLSKKEQSRVTTFVTKFNQNPTLPGFNYERLNNILDSRLHSVRVDQELRCIVLCSRKSATFMLLHVDHHDAAYSWARNRICEIDPGTGGLRVVVHAECTAPSDSDTDPDRIVIPCAEWVSQLDLKTMDRLGVPKELRKAVRTIKDEQDLQDLQESLPPMTYEALCFLQAGDALEDVLQIHDELCREAEELRTTGIPDAPGTAGSDRAETGAAEPDGTAQVSDDASGTDQSAQDQADPDQAGTDGSDEPDELVTALKNPFSRQQFTVNPDEKELNDMMQAPLEKWRVFLHPSQISIVERHWNGPVRVLGGAGTGKTVVALHRARWLARHVCGEQDRILFTTFTATLAMDLERQLDAICTPEERPRIEVRSLDQWVHRFLHSTGYPYTIVYSDRDMGTFLQEARDHVAKRPGSAGLTGRKFSLQFFRDEWEQVVQPQELMTSAAYLAASRKGRGVALSRRERQLIWPVFEEFRSILDRQKIRQPADAMRDARQYLEAEGGPVRYRSVVVDETQDMGIQALRLLRALVKEGPDDMLLVGDAHQRIYGQVTSLARCGIRIVGRSRKLRINYRTTEEIRRTAITFLLDGQADDMDGDCDRIDSYVSLMHGVRPEEISCGSFRELMRQLGDRICTLESSGYATGSICLTARSNDLVRAVADALTAQNLPVYPLSREKWDDRRAPGIRVSTMHRIKGLEFDVVFLIQDEDDRDGFCDTDDLWSARERSLRYVAASRARKELYLCWYQK